MIATILLSFLGAIDKVPDTETIPVGLRKMKEVGLYNVILQIDLGDSTYDFNKFTVYKCCLLVKNGSNGVTTISIRMQKFSSTSEIYQMPWQLVLCECSK